MEESGKKKLIFHENHHFSVQLPHLDRLYSEHCKATSLPRAELEKILGTELAKVGAADPSIVSPAGKTGKREVVKSVIKTLSKTLQRTPCHFLFDPQDQSQAAVVGFTHFSMPSARFGIPDNRLKGTPEIDLVRVEVLPGKATAPDRHLGEEFVFVLDGELEIEFPNSGLTGHLKRHESAHYRSAEVHQLRNRTKRSAHAIAIRAKVEGIVRPFSYASRLELKKEDALKQLNHQLNHFAAENGSENEFARDRYGLGHFFSQQSELIGLKIRQLSDRLKQNGVKNHYSKNYISNLFNGNSKSIPRETAINYAHALEVPIEMLHYFFCHLVRGAICANENLWTDARTTFGTPTSSGVLYQVPKHRLLNTCLAVTQVTLGPAATTPENRHPGSEIIVSLEGEVRVKVGNIEIPVPQGEIAHFNSEEKHFVVNPGSCRAKFLAIRV